MGSVDSNSDPNSYMVWCLPTEPSPQPAFASLICLELIFVCDVRLVSQMLVLKYSLEWVENVELREFSFSKMFHSPARWNRKTLDSVLVLSFVWVSFLWTLPFLASSYHLLLECYPLNFPARAGLQTESKKIGKDNVMMMFEIEISKAPSIGKGEKLLMIPVVS